LLESDESFIKWRWRNTVKNYFNTVRTSISDLKETEDAYLNEVLLCEMQVEQEHVSDDDATPQRVQPAVGPALPPVFSKLDDVQGYNAKILSGSRINCVLCTEFGNRKPLQDSKIRGLCATMLKADFQYQLAKKIRVWNGKGQSYRPFVCIVTVLNEHGLVVYWRALKSGESMKEIQADLDKLDRRLAFNAHSDTSTIKYVYIDNCCTVAKVEDKITAIFKAAAVKLDPFHWQQRWDFILESTTSKEASYFRSAMRRALFVVNEDEFERARAFLQEKKRRRPTTKEILKEARTTIPSPVLLRERVQKVLGYFFYLDSVANAALLNGEDAWKWPRFFKPVTPATRHSINRQMHHIDNGCLTDPTDCDVHITNVSTGKHYVARGTSLNETVNQYLNALLGNSIGIDRAGRLLNCFFEVWNDRLKTQRLGADNFGTVKTEVLALLNSLAAGAGHSKQDLPYPSLSNPTTLPNRFNETMGLDFQFPHSDVSNPVNAANDQRLYSEEESTEELLDMLESIDWDSLDVYDGENGLEEQEQEATEATLFNDDPIDILETSEEEAAELEIDSQVEQLHLLVLDTKSPETSM